MVCAHTYFVLASIYYLKDDYDNVERYCQRALMIEPKNEAIADLYCECGCMPQYKDKVLKFLESQVQKDPFNDACWSALAGVYCHYEQYEQAEQAANCAIAINDKAEKRHFYKAQCLLKKDDIDNAAYHISMACKYCKSDNLCQYILSLSSVLMAKEQWSKALVCLKGVDLLLDNDEDDDHSYLLNMALCYYKIDDNSSAVNCLNKAVDKEVDNQDFLFFGRTLMKCEYYKECELAFYDIFQIDVLDSELRDMAIIFYAAATSMLGNKMDGYATLNALFDNYLDEDSLASLINVLGDNELFNNFTIRALKEIEPKRIKNFLDDYIDLDITQDKNFKKCLKTVLQ